MSSLWAKKGSFGVARFRVQGSTGPRGLKGFRV